MGASSSNSAQDGEDETIENSDIDDVKQYVKKHGLTGLEEFIKAKLGKWKDVEINVAVTGCAGTGKSSFINAVRGLKTDDEGAAPTGVTETTKDPKVYNHPTNDKIKFWDLPGLGTRNYPAETYFEDVGLKKYDTFLILAATRFTENDLKLVHMVKSIEKSFFFVRTKIDSDMSNERRDKPRTFNEEEVLKKIKKNCFENLKELPSKDEDVFLISNHETDNWDFARLTKAILDSLPVRQRESIIFSLDLMKTCSEDILRQKIKLLRGRIWMIAGGAAVGAALLTGELDTPVTTTSEVEFYTSQLGLLEENFKTFAKEMAPESLEHLRKFVLKHETQIRILVGAYDNNSKVDVARFVPVLTATIVGSVRFISTYSSLNGCLNEMEEAVLAFVKSVKEKIVDDMTPE